MKVASVTGPCNVTFVRLGQHSIVLANIRSYWPTIRRLGVLVFNTPFAPLGSTASTELSAAPESIIFSRTQTVRVPSKQVYTRQQSKRPRGSRPPRVNPPSLMQPKIKYTHTTCGIMRGFPGTSTSCARVCSTPLRFSWVSLSNEIGERCSLPRFGSRGTAAPKRVSYSAVPGRRQAARPVAVGAKKGSETTQTKSNAQTSGRSHDALLSV